MLIEVANEYGRKLINGIVKYSKVYGPWTFYRTVPYVYVEYPFNRKFVGDKTFGILKAWHADGIIAHVSDKVAKNVLELNIPTIIATQSTIKGLATITADYLAIGKMAAEHFLNKRFQNFAFCGVGDLLWAQKRGEGFANRLKEAGFDTYIYQSPQNKLNCNWRYEQNHMAKWLKSLPKPIGLLACNDDRAAQLIEACKIAELRVPEQIAVIGVDNDRFICELTHPPLSSIEMDTETAGFEAAKLLDEMIKGNKLSMDEIIIHPTFVEGRESTDILAINDPNIARAIRYIYDNLKRDVLVEEVAAAAMMSRRTLERRFAEILGKSVKHEIRRARVELTAKMLIETNLAIHQIAMALGYPGVDHVSRYFRQEKGMSPLTYRKKYGKK